MTTLFLTTDTPATLNNQDGQGPVEVGVQFRASVPGTVSAIRFYKGSLDTGTHIGSLWHTNGAVMGRATFTGETASGWQQVSLAAPVSIAANTIYIASYYSPTGVYAGNLNYFATNDHVSGTLTAPATGNVAGGNNVFAEPAGSGPTFPTDTFQGSNYWPDIVFNPNAAATSPAVPTAISFSSVVTMIADNASAGALLATAVVAMSDGSPFNGSLATSNTTLFAINGMHVILARALTSADDGPHTTTITALDITGHIISAVLVI